MIETKEVPRADCEGVQSAPMGGVLICPQTQGEREQLHVFIQALKVYSERNAKYNDNWRRMGWRGMLVRVRERAERLWDDLWDAEGPLQRDGAPEIDVDDAIDLINLTGFLVRGVHDGIRDGSWWGRP